MRSRSAGQQITEVETLAVLRLCLGLVLLFCSAEVLAAKTDVVVLINGDRITGEVKKLERGILSYSTDFMGTINIEWDKIAQLRSDQLLEIEMIDGEKLYGRAGTLGDDGAVLLELVDGGENRSVPIEQTVRIAALDEGRLRDRLDGYFSFGWSAQAANSVSQYSVGAGVTYRDEIRLWDYAYDAARSSSDTNPSSERQTLQIEQRRFLRDRWFWAGGANFSTNDELGLDLRTLVGGGFGRYFLQTGTQELAGMAGVGLTREQFSDGQDKKSVEGILTGSYDLFRFDSPEIDLSTVLTLYPSFTISGRVRAEANIRARYEIIKDLFYELSYLFSYDNEPQSEGAAQRDWSVVTSLGYKF